MFPYPNISTISLFGVQVSVFVLLVLVGIAAGIMFVSHRARRLGISFDEQWGATAYGLYMGFICAHLTTLVFYEPHKLENHGPLILLHIWHGLSSIGGFVGGVAGLAVYYRRPGRSVLTQAFLLVAPLLAACVTIVSRPGGKIALAASVAAIFWYYRRSRMPWLRQVEIGFQGLIIAWIFGRAACTLIYDHPGAPTDFLLGFAYLDGVVRHNLGFYEAIYTTVVLLPAMFMLQHRGVRDGMIMVVLALLYSPARFLADFLRATDLPLSEPRLMGLTPGQYGSVVLFIAALVLLRWIRHRPTEVAADQVT